MDCKGTGHVVRQADYDTAEGDSRVDFVAAAVLKDLQMLVLTRHLSLLG